MAKLTFVRRFFLPTIFLLFVPISTQAGNSTVAVDIGGVGQYTSLTLDASGNPVISYFDNTKSKLKVVHCFEKNCALFNSIVLPDAASQIGSYTSIALNSSGNPVVSYYDIANSALKILRCGNSSCLSGNSIATPDTVGTVGQYTSLTLNNNDWPVVTYYDATKGKLKILRCGNTTCTAGNSIITPDLNSNNGVQSAVKLNSLGNPVIAYFDFTNSALKVLRCGNSTCTANNVTATPDSAGDVGRHPAITLDSDGFPVVSYLDLTNKKMKILHCGNTTCTSNNSITTPDMAGQVGYYSSIALDVAGNPVVSYYDSGNHDLKLLHCGNANCTSDNIVISPDTVGQVGLYTSLKLDKIGNPVVSYHDTTNGALKVLHCASPNCGPNTISVPAASANNDGQYSSIKLDTNGKPVVSYYDQTNGDLRILHCGNENCTGTNSVITAANVGNTGWDTSIALDANGNPVVSFYDHTAGNMKVMHCSDANCAGAKSTATPDILSHRLTSLALDATGHPVIASAGQSDQGLRVVHCGDANCTSNNTVASPDFPAYPFNADVRAVSMVLDSNGNPVVSFYRADKGQLKVLHCTDANCSAQNNPIATPDPGAVAATHRATSITLDANGYPVVAYHDSANNKLKILHCGNENCSANNTIESPITNAGIELDPYIKLDASGNPVVSFTSEKGLQVLHCGNATCSSGNTFALADSLGKTGWDSALILDNAGNPVVSYYSYSTKDLKVLHCSTTTCL